MAFLVEYLEIPESGVGNVNIPIHVHPDAPRSGEAAVLASRAPPCAQELAVLVESLHPEVARVEHVKSPVGSDSGVGGQVELPFLHSTPPYDPHFFAILVIHHHLVARALHSACVDHVHTPAVRGDGNVGWLYNIGSA